MSSDGTIAESRFFASDNGASVHPVVLEAIQAANRGSALAYGDDPWTHRAIEVLRGHFGEAAAVLPVFGGTGANVVALRAAVDSYQAILCPDVAHLNNDECGAPERILGCKLMPVVSRHGKIDPAAIEPLLWARGVVHYAQPRVISISQPTEWGTLYRLEELRALADFAHQHELLLHVDGARLPNAAAALGTSLGALITDAGVDLLSLGGTKCGLLGAEAVVLLRPELAERAGFFRKQCMQLPSKMRFISAQLEALFVGELWHQLAAHANAMASRLAAALPTEVELAHPVETNALFARLSQAAISALSERFVFGAWPREAGLVRWMTAWDTRPEDVDAFALVIREQTASRGG